MNVLVAVRPFRDVPIIRAPRFRSRSLGDVRFALLAESDDDHGDTRNDGDAIQGRIGRCSSAATVTPPTLTTSRRDVKPPPRMKTNAPAMISAAPEIVDKRIVLSRKRPDEVA